MPEATKDPAIKLFGKTIQLPDAPALATEMDVDPGGTASVLSGDDCSAKDSSCSETASAEGGEDEQVKKNENGEKLDDSKEDEGTVSSKGEEIMDQTADEMRGGLKAPPVDEDGEISRTEEEGKMGNGKDKTLKKPDKILPCPRCDSMDTKFCYFNNYNVNQPRHFCKKCQRYWTSGGMTRNLPVGAGRRKSKNSATHYHHLNAVKSFQTARVEHPEGIQHHSLKANGKVLTLASDCDSVASALNIAEKTPGNGSLNGFYKPVELGIPVSYGAGDNGADHSSGSSVTAASTKDDISKNGLPDVPRQDYHGFTPQLPCFPGPPWPYPPGCFSPGFPMPFYPPAMYWGYTVPCSWNVPWMSRPVAPQQHTSSGPNSPTLGKHSRDDKPANSKEGEPPKDSNPEKCLWFPKTLRFDDPEDAAKSSIWATLGIKNDRVDSIRGGAFKAFKLKDDEKNPASKNCRVLEANPAALSRSLNFHESS